MSEQTQVEFEHLVKECYQRHKQAINLTAPQFYRNGYITKATMFGSGGSIEILCGPAEYHAELFINSQKDKRRWNLADLMSFDPIREWLVSYSKNANTAERSALAADTEWIFLILVDGLKGVSNFEWIASGKADK